MGYPATPDGSNIFIGKEPFKLINFKEDLLLSLRALLSRAKEQHLQYHIPHPPQVRSTAVYQPNSQTNSELYLTHSKAKTSEAIAEKEEALCKWRDGCVWVRTKSMLCRCGGQNAAYSFLDFN